ncbi:hypothetical protein P5A20_03320 [Enterobacter hormaechei subsp. xiangfangensis]|nr:hypothetical protein [Enterobacter hormaechei subsp. xiangfangensis]
MNKNFTAIFVMGIVLAGTMSQAEAANTVWDDQQITNIVNDHQDQITQNNADSIKESANKQVMSSQADSLIKISRIWADFFPANTSNQPI